MKQTLYVCSSLLLVTSFGLAGGRSYAAHQDAKKTISVRLCSSAPVGVPALQHLSQGIFNGAKLATAQWKSRLKTVGVNLGPVMTMDYAKSDGSGYSTDQERQNALKCLGAKGTLGYVGTLNSGAALVSEPILNRGGMAMISPANTNPDLTNPAKRTTQEPSTASGKLKTVTYFRTVTTDALQGPGGAIYLKNGLHVKTYFLVDDKLTYGAGLAGAMNTYASGHGMQQVGSGHIDPQDSSTIAQSSDAVADQVVAKNPDAVYCGCDSENAITFARDLRSKGYTKPFTGGDALFNAAWIQKTGSASTNNFVTSVGPDPAKTSKSFQQAYKKMFHTDLDAYDAPSYDAGNVLLNAIYQAAKAGKLTGSPFKMRSTVAVYVSKLKWNGATGITSFDRNGDTKNRIVSIYSVKGGSWKYVGASKVNGMKPTG